MSVSRHRLLIICLHTNISLIDGSRSSQIHGHTCFGQALESRVNFVLFRFTNHAFERHSFLALAFLLNSSMIILNLVAVKV